MRSNWRERSASAQQQGWKSCCAAALLGVSIRVGLDTFDIQEVLSLVETSAHGLQSVVDQLQDWELEGSILMFPNFRMSGGSCRTSMRGQA